jgi:hypothetical protein
MTAAAALFTAPDGQTVNNLTSTATNAPLAAAQGKILDEAKLDKAGGTLTGPLTLAGDASANLHPVTKQQFDAALSGVGTIHDAADIAARDALLVAGTVAVKDVVHVIDDGDGKWARYQRLAASWVKTADQDGVGDSLIGVLDDVTNLISLSGVAVDSVTLGTFAGSIIPDASAVKTALQALETELEAARRWGVLTGAGPHAIVANRRYIVPASSTVTFPAGSIGDEIKLIAANGDWPSLGSTLNGNGADTIGTGQPAIAAGAAAVTFVKATATNWMIAT